MASIADVKVGMEVRGAEGARLGKVSRCDREGFHVERRRLLSVYRFFVRYEDVAGVEGAALKLTRLSAEVAASPSSAPRFFTDTGEKEIATGVAEERRSPFAPVNSHASGSRNKPAA